MLRPYICMPRAYTSIPTVQFRAREPLGLLDVGLIVRVDAEPLTQRGRGVLPAQKLAAEVERIGGEQVGPGGLRVGQRAAGGILYDGHHAAPVLAGTLGDELLDPIRERADPGRWGQAQLVPAGQRPVRDAQAHRLGRRNVDGPRPLEQGAAVESAQRGGDHADRRQRGIAATDAGWMWDDRAEAPPARDAVELAPGLRDGDELLGTRPRREVVAERKRLDRIARLAGDDERRSREVGFVAGPTDGGGVGAVQYVETPHAKRLSEDVGDE